MLDAPDVAAGATEAPDREGGTEAVNAAAPPAAAQRTSKAFECRGVGLRFTQG